MQTFQQEFLVEKLHQNDKDIFDKIISDKDSSIEIDFLTYAIYSYEKYDWIKSYNQEHNTNPTEDQITNWVESITDFRLNNMREEALRFFIEAADRYCRETIDIEIEERINNSILSAVKSSSSFYKQLSLALITSIVAPLILGAILAAISNWDKIIKHF